MTGRDPDRSARLDKIVDGVRRATGRDALSRFRSITQSTLHGVLPSGCLALDLATGVGGYPFGRIVEVYGPESSGKTTLALHAIAMAQAAGHAAAFVDAEHAMDPAYAAAIGVDLDDLLFIQPDTGEEALQTTQEMVERGVRLVVVDSIAALTPKAEIEGKIGDSHVGLQARMMSQALRKMTGAASKNGVVVFFINQIRMKIGVMFGSPEITSGGNALKFYASLRLDVRRKDKLKSGDEITGNVHKVKVVKNKVAPPFAECEFDLVFGHGVDHAADLLAVALQLGVVEQHGSWLLVGREKLAQGRFNARDKLAADPELSAKVLAAVHAAKPFLGGS